MFHVLMRVEVRHLKKYLRFILKIPNCGAFTVLLIQTQPAITCSKLTIETLEQGVKYVQS